MLSSEEFKKQQDKWVLVMLDFPQIRKHRPADKVALMKEYGVEGFPTAVVLGPDGKQRGSVVGAEEKPAKYIRELELCREAEPYEDEQGDEEED